MKDRQQILLRAPSRLLNILEKMAESQGFTRNALILQILWDWVKSQPEVSAVIGIPIPELAGQEHREE